jgi:serine O-acetyltransferase
MNEVSVTARERFRADLARYFAYYDNPKSRLKRFKIVTKTEGIWAIALFRFGQYLQLEAGPVTRFLFKIPYELTAKLMRFTVGIHIFPRTRVGPGLYIGHYGGIWITVLATIGANCNIGQGVTIGTARRGITKGPELGDRVWVGPNATISGQVKVGSGAVVGANTLVVSDVPENAVVVGVPARILSYTGSDNLIGLSETDTPSSG